MTNYLTILQELIHLWSPEELEIYTPLPEDYARMNRQLAELFQVLPPDHIIWRQAQIQELEATFYANDLKRRDDALKDIGLAFHRAGPEMHIYVDDYPRLAEAFHDYTAKHGPTDIKTAFDKFRTA